MVKLEKSSIWKFRQAFFNKGFLKGFRYFCDVFVSTPYWGLICVLQILSACTSFLGLPLLVPVLELMQGDDVSKQSLGYLKVFMPFFKSCGIEVNFRSMLCLAAGLILIGQLLVNASSLVTAFVRERLLMQYRKKILQSYFLVDWQWLTDHNSGKLYYDLSAGSVYAADVHLNALSAFINCFQILIFLAIALRLSFQVTLFAIGVYVGLTLLNILSRQKLSNLTLEMNAKEEALSNELVSFQHNKKFIKVALLEGMFSASLSHMIDSSRRLKKRQMFHMEMQRAWNMMSTFMLLIVLIAFHKAFLLNYASLLLILFVFMRIAPQFVAFSDILSALEMRIPIFKALQAHLKDLEIHREKNGTGRFLMNTPVSFKNVRFSYPNQPELFSDLNLLITPNTVVAFVGPSGSGKSTILDLFLGLYDPLGGTIYYGDIPHPQLDKNSLRQLVAFVGQRPSLLAGTLRENLTIVARSAKDEEILEVCQQVHLKDFIDQLPQGLDTFVGENGVKLSGGQRQRIALARCLLTKPKILILDEATSELDLESEAIIQRSLKELRAGMTTIVVAHRLSTIKGADKIFVIDGGKVCESGTYEELLARKGRFFALAAAQH
ncbi:MAG: ABC transporter ATP-binding protein [Candidatus Omnitrophica bacterium]|nr:ABC transporter ATP-binding protein [Candidatus Omnitrophota bacterium]